jgi:hypothetical protein
MLPSKTIPEPPGKPAAHNLRKKPCKSASRRVKKHARDPDMTEAPPRKRVFIEDVRDEGDGPPAAVIAAQKKVRLLLTVLVASHVVLAIWKAKPHLSILRGCSQIRNWGNWSSRGCPLQVLPWQSQNVDNHPCNEKQSQWSVSFSLHMKAIQEPHR